MSKCPTEGTLNHRWPPAAKARRWFEKRYKVMNELALELDAFADCVRRNREPAPNGAEGLRDVAVMQAIYQSAREGRPVSINVEDRGAA